MPTIHLTAEEFAILQQGRNHVIRNPSPSVNLLMGTSVRQIEQANRPAAHSGRMYRVRILTDVSCFIIHSRKGIRTMSGLTIKRKKGQALTIGLVNVEVVSINGTSVMLRINAPEDVAINRTETKRVTGEES